MKKLITFTAASILSLAGFALPAFADDEDRDFQARVEQQLFQASVHEHGYQREHNAHREHGGSGQLRREVYHLNRMLNHVRREMRAYGAGRRIRRQFEHIRLEAYRLNNQLRRGEQYYDPQRVRAQIEHMHEELHQIEEELDFRAEDLYRWR